ncbi:MAG TPA: alpha/beta hydrolase [Actinomycetota bacterium]
MRAQVGRGGGGPGMRKHLALAPGIAFALFLAALSYPGRVEASIIRYPDILYHTVGNVQLYLDVYVPSATGAPAVLWVHGGAWARGDKNDAKVISEATDLANEGFVVFSVNYRLACTDPGNPLCGYQYDAPVLDLEAAMTWIRANGASPPYNANVGKVGAWGNSAGGNLAGMLGDRGRPGGTKADVIISPSGANDLHDWGGPKAQEVRTDYIGCTYSVCPTTWQDASPLYHVDATASPYWMSGGSLDDKVPPTDSLLMKQALDAVSVPNERHIVSGKCHALGCFDYDPSLWPSAVRFLHTYLPAGVQGNLEPMLSASVLVLPSDAQRP